MTAALRDLLGAVMSGLVDAQTELDERARDSIDEFEHNGVLPTALTWSSMRLEIPLGLVLRPKSTAGGIADDRVDSLGDGSLTCRLRYLMAPQGVDDPRPQLTDEPQEDPR